MQWAQRQRLSFIGERLLSRGIINRSDLRRQFGISVPQASVDFRQFNKSNPGAMKYDKMRKAYVSDRLLPGGRDTTTAASRLMHADDEELALIACRDPGMIRDVAAAFLLRSPGRDSGVVPS